MNLIEIILSVLFAIVGLSIVHYGTAPVKPKDSKKKGFPIAP